MTISARNAGLGLLVLVLAVGAPVAYLTVNHVLLTITVALGLLFGLLAAVVSNGLRQISPAALKARGIDPGRHDRPVLDSGLRRDYAPPPLPFRLGRRTRTTVAAGGPPRAQPSRTTVTSPHPGRAPQPGRRPRPGRSRGPSLHAGDTVTLAAESREAGVDELLAALDEQLVGLLPVKRKVAEIGSLLLVDRVRQRFGLAASPPNLHMCFTGPPGTGKTTVALMMAGLLHRLGYLQKGQLVHAMRDDLVGEYIGQTAPKTRQVLDRAMGGLLFIDEAYSLYRAHDSKDYGAECVDILMQVMENRRGKLVVVLAGYKDRMDTFFESNPGMRSRVAHHLDFAAYQTGELLEIGQLMLDESSYYLSDAAAAAFRQYLSQERSRPDFAYARSVRNALENARLRHAFRLAAEPDRAWAKDDLMRLEPADIMPGLHLL